MYIEESKAKLAYRKVRDLYITKVSDDMVERPNLHFGVWLVETVIIASLLYIVFAG